MTVPPDRRARNRDATLVWLGWVVLAALAVVVVATVARRAGVSVLH